MRQIRVLIVDDHKVVREGLKVLLECDEEMTVVGEAENGEEAIAIAAQTNPDVIIMDVSMPLMNGRVATIKLRQSVPAAKVLVLSTYHDDDLVREMAFAGAAGFLVKQSTGEDLLTAVRAVMKNESSYSPCIMERFRRAKQREEMTGGASELTPREIEVLELVAEGFTNKGIGLSMGISVKTVEKHRQQVMNKLNIHEAAGLTRYALQKGISAKR